MDTATCDLGPTPSTPHSRSSTPRNRPREYDIPTHAILLEFPKLEWDLHCSAMLSIALQQLSVSLEWEPALRFAFPKLGRGKDQDASGGPLFSAPCRRRGGTVLRSPGTGFCVGPSPDLKRGSTCTGWGAKKPPKRPTVRRGAKKPPKPPSYYFLGRGAKKPPVAGALKKPQNQEN